VQLKTIIAVVLVLGTIRGATAGDLFDGSAQFFVRVPLGQVQTQENPVRFGLQFGPADSYSFDRLGKFSIAETVTLEFDPLNGGSLTVAGLTFPLLPGAKTNSVAPDTPAQVGLGLEPAAAAPLDLLPTNQAAPPNAVIATRGDWRFQPHGAPNDDPNSQWIGDLIALVGPQL